MKPEPWVCRADCDPCCNDIHNVVDYSLVRHTSVVCAAAMLAPDWWRQYQVPWAEEELGDWSIRKYEITPAWALLYNQRNPDPGLHVQPGSYTKLVRQGWEVVMSDTRAEIMDHMEFIDRAHGRVLINGLGLGVSLRAILAKGDGKCVEHVDVVEKEPDVLRLMAPYFQDDPRVSLQLGDAFEMKWPTGWSWHVAWHDIWSSINPDDLAEHTRLIRRYQNRVGWQACWKQRWMRGFDNWRKRQDSEAVEA